MTETKHTTHPRVEMTPDKVRDVAKASAFLRFAASQWEWLSIPAQREIRRMADTLTELENEVVELNAAQVQGSDTQ